MDIKDKMSMFNILAVSFLSLTVILFMVLFLISGKVYRDQERDRRELTELVTKVSGAKEASPEMESVLPYDIDWDSLYAINPDVVAWIVIPDTDISYPVCQTSDNDYYVEHSFKKEVSKAGAVFMDCENRADFSDYNTVLYGHNMRNGSMFACLNKYADSAFYKEHSDVWLLTPMWQRCYGIVSAHIAVGGDATYDIPKDEGEFSSFLGRETAESLYKTDRLPDSGKTLVLSTCRGHNSDKRFVLVCRPEYQIDALEE